MFKGKKKRELVEKKLIKSITNLKKENLKIINKTFLPVEYEFVFNLINAQILDSQTNIVYFITNKERTNGT